ncbi:alpha/beta fold hydrolase [Streptomyces ossamyceticus]|nr:alpha/beta fold hydrolase [Streptomyces ossamyceticus]
MPDMALTSRRLGSGPPLLVVLQLDRDGWAPVLERLAREYEVVGVDLPGFGDSPALPEGTTPTVEALAAAVAEWLPGVGLTRPPVVGNSLGGAVALELARIGAVGSAVALSPIGLWTRAEAAYALGSLRVAHAMAGACAEHPGWIAGNPIGRTVAFWQLVARPWRITEEVAAGALRNLARSPGFEPTRRAAHAYRLQAFTPAVPVPTREEEFTTASPRHPMSLTVKLGAKADGKLTAFQVRNVSNTGAYGNHGGETLYAGGAAVMIYRCPNKKYDAYSVYTNTLPSGALRGYGMTQPAFAVESAMDELARALHIDPLELRRRNIVRPGEPLLAMHEGPDDVVFTEDGLARCIDLVGRGPGSYGRPAAPRPGVARRSRRGEFPARDRAPDGPPLRGMGHAGRRSHLRTGRRTTEFGEGTSTAHVQIAANQLGTTPSRIRLVQSDTDRTGFDTGAFASAGLFVAGNALLRAANAVRDRILQFAAAHTGIHVVMCTMDDDGVVCGDRRVPLAELVALARRRGIRFTAARKAYGSPRSVTSNTQGFRVAVHRVTGEIRILYSVQAADAGVIINPAQVRGQVEGGVAQGIGFALTENHQLDGNGVMVNPNLRTTASPPTPTSPVPRSSWWARRIRSGPCGRRGWRSAASTRWPPRSRTRCRTPRVSATVRCR